MNKEEVKVLIIDCVNSRQGLKSIELPALLMDRLEQNEDTFHELLSIGIYESVVELVKEGKLVEVEYILPNMDYRMRSFLLPGGTEVITNKVYYYLTYNSGEREQRTFRASNDSEALSKLKEEFGEHLVGVSNVWTRTENSVNRTVWME